MKSFFGVKGLNEPLVYLGSQAVAGGALQPQRTQILGSVGRVVCQSPSEIAAQCSHGQHVNERAWLWPLPLPYRNV